MIALSPQTVEKSAQLIADRKLGFEILHDAGNAIADAFGLRYALPDDLLALYDTFGIDLEASNGDDSGTLPIPARYIVDREGIVRYARVDPDYTVRPEPEDTVEALRALVG